MDMAELRSLCARHLPTDKATGALDCIDEARAEVERLKQFTICGCDGQCEHAARADAGEAEVAKLEEDRPYWLWRCLLDECSLLDCPNAADLSCDQSSMCITEWCVGCAARAFRAALAERKAGEKG